MTPECVCGTPCQWQCPECRTPVCQTCAYGHRMEYHGAPNIFAPADDIITTRRRTTRARPRANGDATVGRVLLGMLAAFVAVVAVVAVINLATKKPPPQEVIVIGDRRR